jgi:hypothetical protein
VDITGSTSDAVAPGSNSSMHMGQHLESTSELSPSFVSTATGKSSGTSRRALFAGGSSLRNQSGGGITSSNRVNPSGGGSPNMVFLANSVARRPIGRGIEHTITGWLCTRQGAGAPSSSNTVTNLWHRCESFQNVYKVDLLCLDALYYIHYNE